MLTNRAPGHWAFMLLAMLGGPLRAQDHTMPPEAERRLAREIDREMVVRAGEAAGGAAG